MPFMLPPVDVTAPVSEPFCNMPPERSTVLIACAKPPKSTVPPGVIVVALPWEKPFAADAVRIPPVTVVAPV